MEKLPVYASIGALIVDDIVYQDGTEVKDVLGGGGVFAVYGLRLWHTSENSKDVGYIIHAGFDYPQEIDSQIKSLDISLVELRHPDIHTTRGLNTFGLNDHRDFEYKHPIIRTTTSDFPDDWIKSIQVLHLISSPERAIEIIDEWKQRELELNSTAKTEFLWEPLPWACLPENLNDIYDASNRTEIITPNHEEIAEMLGINFNKLLIENQNNFQKCVEYCGNKFLDGVSSTSKIKTLVIRGSKYGALVIQVDTRANHWVPAYWDWQSKSDQAHVVDVTGAGNAFCGGFAFGWIKTKGDPVESAYYGAISASYTVEQMSVPQFSIGSNLWNNGPNPAERLCKLKAKSF